MGSGASRYRPSIRLRHSLLDFIRSRRLQKSDSSYLSSWHALGVVASSPYPMEADIDFRIPSCAYSVFGLSELADA